MCSGTLSERLRRQIRNLLGFARAGSNPAGVVVFSFTCITNLSCNGSMAEWSKALDSSSSLHLEAWVRIPLEPCIDGPCGAMDSALDFESSGCRFESCQGRTFWFLVSGLPVRDPSNRRIIHNEWGISSIGRVRALQARGTGIETRILHFPFCP